MRALVQHGPDRASHWLPVNAVTGMLIAGLLPLGMLPFLAMPR